MRREEAAAHAARDELRRAADPIYVKEWNERLARGAPHLFSPTIGAALVSGYPWLAVYCGGCRSMQDVDLRTIDRHPRASIESLIPSLRCTRCNGHAPMPELKGLTKFKPAPHRSSGTA